jgi:hypothetical protein
MPSTYSRPSMAGGNRDNWEDQGMAEENELLHVNGHVFDTDDLSYAERRAIKVIARTEIWDEDVDGPFQDMNEDDLMPAIILVFMRREDPEYTLELAAALKPSEVFPDPPTEQPAKPRTPRKRAAPASAT